MKFLTAVAVLLAAWTDMAAAQDCGTSAVLLSECIAEIPECQNCPAADMACEVVIDVECCAVCAELAVQHIGCCDIQFNNDATAVPTEDAGTESPTTGAPDAATEPPLTDPPATDPPATDPPGPDGPLDGPDGATDGPEETDAPSETQAPTEGADDAEETATPSGTVAPTEGTTEETMAPTDEETTAEPEPPTGAPTTGAQGIDPSAAPKQVVMAVMSVVGATAIALAL